MPATSIRERTTVSVTGSCCFVANLDAALPLGDRAAIDVGGQAGQNAAGGGIGLWIRGDGEGDPGAPRGGGRLGLNAGTGDMLGVLAYDMPYVGFSLLGQVAMPYEDGHVLSVTGGIEMQRPLDLDIDETTRTDGGERVPIAPTSDIFLDVDVNGEIVIADPIAMVVGGSIHTMVLPLLVPIPTFSVGLRF